MGNFAGSAVSPRCATSLTTSPSKRARCSKRACRRKRHSTGTSSRRNSKISLCFPGDLPSARRSRSFTRSDRKRNRRRDRSLFGSLTTEFSQATGTGDGSRKRKRTPVFRWFQQETGRSAMTDSAQPFAAKKFLEIKGRRMAYIDEGEGAPIVFAHGNPTSSYLRRNVMPACRGLGRLIACDMIGMGDSEKLPDSGPDRYTYAEQRSFLFALWKELGVDTDVVFVLHDWGSLLGFDWTRQHPERVQGIAYMEALVQPMTWADWPDAQNERSIFQGFRSKDGETMVLQKNMFVENLLPGAVLRRLSEDEMAAYRAPFANAGEDRRPTLTWPRQIPIEGEPPEVVRVATDCGRWLAESRIPKLFINAEPGAILTGRQREFCRTWRNQTELTVKGIHFIQEDSPEEIGEGIAAFVRSLRNL